MNRCFAPILALFVTLESLRAATAAPPTINAVTPVVATGQSALNVGQYEKLELAVDLRAEYDNAFDPDDIDLAADFVAPSGKRYHVFGFFEPTGKQWLVRFAPPETGAWRYTLGLRDRNGDVASEAHNFRCVVSGRHGFISIGPNKRYFQHSDGTSFYGVGLWYNDHFRRGRGAITPEALGDLARRGFNFIGFYPSLLETDDTGLGRYDAERCDRLDDVVRWCEDRDLAISWNLVFHANISEAVWGEGNSGYGRNPYRTIAKARDYFASDEAWAYQQKLNRYILARWGYSRSIFLWFIIDEINGCEGWTEGDRDAAHTWCRKMNDFFHAHDPYGRATTGTQSGGIDQWWSEGYAIFDVAGRELYEAQGHPMPTGKVDLLNANPVRASYLNYFKQVADLWSGFAKPAIIAETGYDHTYYEPGTPGYLATYHNALWVSLANGAAVTPMWWAYWPPITDGLLGEHVKAFAQFTAGIDFAKKDWAPQAVEIDAGDAWVMRAGGEAFGWAVNPTSGIAGATVTIDGLATGEYDVRLYRPWQCEYLPTIKANVNDGSLTFAVPMTEPEAGHANNLGDDIAFKITPSSTASAP
jgi:hypothetical protein